MRWNLTSGNLHPISSASDTSKFAKRLEPTAFLDSTRDALRYIIERAVARGKARKEPSQLPRIGMANDAVDKVRRGGHLKKPGDSPRVFLTRRLFRPFRASENCCVPNPRAALHFVLGYPLAPRWGIKPLGKRSMNPRITPPSSLDQSLQS